MQDPFWNSLDVHENSMLQAEKVVRLDGSNLVPAVGAEEMNVVFLVFLKVGLAHHKVN